MLKGERSFAALRMTRLSFVVILSGAKNLYESRIGNLWFSLLQYT